MTDLSMQRALDQALGDFAERRGKLYFQQIRTEQGVKLRQLGRIIAIDALTGEYVLGESISAALDLFRQKFGDRAVAWLVDLDDAQCQ